LLGPPAEMAAGQVLPVTCPDDVRIATSRAEFGARLRQKRGNQQVALVLSRPLFCLRLKMQTIDEERQSEGSLSASRKQNGGQQGGKSGNAGRVVRPHGRLHGLRISPQASATVRMMSFIALPRLCQQKCVRAILPIQRRRARCFPSRPGLRFPAPRSAQRAQWRERAAALRLQPR